ncbi:MAG: cytochrome c biogenesis protein CcsA [Bacteroidota bacterium]
MEFTGGKLGELFTSLAFAASLVAMISFFLADMREGKEKANWEKMGLWGFGIHALSILGIIATLFGLIYTHNYNYHYVWAHASNELPVHFMISCFWEGQEGSFLLWCFWHAVLGVILMRSKADWRNGVMGIIASIELILSSMLLGVYVNESIVWGAYLLLALLPSMYLGYLFVRQRDELSLNGNFHLASLFVGGSFLLLLFSGQLGHSVGLIPSMEVFSLSGMGFWLLLLFVLGYAALYFVYVGKVAKTAKAHLWELVSGAVLIALGLFVVYYDPEVWKLGSTPFLTIKDAFPDDKVWATDPNFVPKNGTGLNPLLQNYWMVIHPPTLFLGFASTTVPFAFVMAGLIRGKYDQWIKPSMPWMSFSVMILGIGIIMGGYWAYETLNFGGYWNWDPVENSSFVPWLTGVASLHAMLIYRKTKAYLKMAMLLIISTFLLVLYSTFLTRSGILGDTSVHTFTDLGLSGQLLVLVAIYVTFVAVVMFYRWKDIPQRSDESKVWSAEFWLFMGVLVFLGSSLAILVFTSLPVFNKIFGTSAALPGYVQFFYYQWTIFFAVGFGVASGIGQFLWWKMGKGKAIGDALFRPFLIAVLSGCAILVGIWYGVEWNFAFDDEFAEIISEEKLSGNALSDVFSYIYFGIFNIGDELLLFSSLFAFFANLDVLISLLRKNRKGLKVMGGTVVHIGFALMLIGMLFSSGYDQVISKNLRPEDLARFPEKERMDNVLLPKNDPTQIWGYDVTYIGKKEAKAPVSDLRILEEDLLNAKIAFEDASGDTWALIVPRGPFLKKETNNIHSTSDNEAAVQREVLGEIDLNLIQNKLNQNLSSFEPERINGRMLFGLRFDKLGETQHSFTVFPESEINMTGDGIINHPSRQIYWNKDVYVHVSSLPKSEEAETRFFNLDMQIGDTARYEDVVFYLENLTNLSQRPDLTKYDVAAAANLKAFRAGKTYSTQPVFVIEGNKPGMIQDRIEELGMDFAFVGIEPDKNMVHLQVRYVKPDADFVIIKAIQKPFINLLWLGTFILTAGFLISIYRRVQESKKK